jgi:hypothetical protein
VLDCWRITAADGKLNSFEHVERQHRPNQPAFALLEILPKLLTIELALQAEQRWRRLNGTGLLSDVITGVVFVDGAKKAARAEDHRQSCLA